jgi:hypothetical protein
MAHTSLNSADIVPEDENESDSDTSENLHPRSLPFTTPMKRHSCQKLTPNIQKQDPYISIGTEIKEGLVSMGQQMALAMKSSSNNDIGELKNVVKLQAAQLSETNALLREFLLKRAK